MTFGFAVKAKKWATRARHIHTTQAAARRSSVFPLRAVRDDFYRLIRYPLEETVAIIVPASSVIRIS